MKTLIRLLKNRQEGLPKKKKPARQKPLPYDWHHVVWQGNHMVMNHYPVWGYPPATFMENKLHKVLLHKIVELDRLPSLDELKSALRTKENKEKVSDLFLNEAKREMHEVDFEIGLHHAFTFMSEPLNQNIHGLAKRVKKGSDSAGMIIQRYYSPDGR